MRSTRRAAFKTSNRGCLSGLGEPVDEKALQVPDGVLHYFEAWDRDGVAIIHAGRVGDRGTARELRPEPGESVEAVMRRDAGSDGLSPISDHVVCGQHTSRLEA